MTQTTKTKAPTSFWVISVIALIWNLMGFAAFLADMFISQEALAALPDAERTLYESTPVWLKAVYGVAVIGGSLACIFLLMRKSFAIQLFLISIIAILIQMSYSLFMTNAFEVYGPVGIVMPLLVTGIGIFLLWYARRSKAQKWIN